MYYVATPHCLEPPNYDLISLLFICFSNQDTELIMLIMDLSFTRSSGAAAIYSLYQQGVPRYWWGSLRERGHWGDKDVDGRIILRWIFRKLEEVVRTEWSWLRIGTGGGHLWVW